MYSSSPEFIMEDHHFFFLRISLFFFAFQLQMKDYTCYNIIVTPDIVRVQHGLNLFYYRVNRWHAGGGDMGSGTCATSMFYVPGVREEYM